MVKVGFWMRWSPSKSQSDVFPFRAELTTRGGVLSESFEPFLRVLNYIFQYFMGVLTRDRGGIASENGHLAPPKNVGGAK